MDEIKLMERLMEENVKEICNAAVNAAQQFNFEYCTRNDCQHVTSNVSLARDIIEEVGDWKVYQLTEYPKRFGDLRKLISEVILLRGLKPRGVNPYNNSVAPIDFRSYSSADKYIEMIVNR